MSKYQRSDGTLLLSLAVLILVVLVGWLAGPRVVPRSVRPLTTSTENAWPGSDDVTAVDDTAAFHANLSGLAYERGTLWAVQNGPGTLYRLHQNGDQWMLDSTSGWAHGKQLRYPDSGGNVDAEGIALVGGGSAAGIYVASERNNESNKVSRNSVLRFVPTDDSAILRATNEWDLTRDLPAVGANVGLESITWIPDSALVAGKFLDETTGRPYDPAIHPEHGDGLFFVGLEKNAMIYVYALNHATNGFTRIALVASGHAKGVMALEYDRESGQLWSTCDDTCGNTMAILALDTGGRFVVSQRFARPSTLPNVNNEGFAIASDCVGGRKAVLWADDSDTGGHSIRRASLPCGAIPRLP